MTRKVVITGMGTVNGCGLNVAQTWDAMINGRHGFAPITAFDTTNFQVKLAAEVKDFDPTAYMEAKEARRMDRYQHFAIAAAREALAQSGLAITDESRGSRSRTRTPIGWPWSSARRSAAQGPSRMRCARSTAPGLAGSTSS